MRQLNFHSPFKYHNSESFDIKTITITTRFNPFQVDIPIYQVCVHVYRLYGPLKATFIVIAIISTAPTIYKLFHHNDEDMQF